MHMGICMHVGCNMIVTNILWAVFCISKIDWRFASGNFSVVILFAINDDLVFMDPFAILTAGTPTTMNQTG